jgi:two-component system, response regulator YesN
VSKQRNYLQYRFFNRLFLYTTSLLVVVIVLVTSVLYAIFSNAMIEDASRNTQALLMKTSYSADVVKDEVETLCRALMSDTVIFNYITDSKIEPVEEYMTLRRLSDIVKAYPNIYRVGIYNATVNRYLTNNGVATDESVDSTSIQCLKQDNSTDYITFLPQILSAWPSPDAAQRAPVLTYVIHPGWISSNQTPCGFIIHIKQSYLQDTVNGLSNNHSDDLFVMDKNGSILSSSQKNKFLSTVADKNYVRKILEGGQADGSFACSVDGRKSLVSFVQTDTGLYFVNVQPYRQLLENITNAQYLVLVIAGAILLAGTASAFILARKLYNPIDSLLTKLNALPTRRNRREDDMELLADAYSRLSNQTIQLQSTIESAIPVFQDTYLKSLLNSSDASHLSLPQMLQQLEETLKGPCYFVALLRLDEPDNCRRAAPEADRGVFRFALGNIAHDIISKIYDNCIVCTGADEVAIIAQSAGHEPQSLLKIALEELFCTIHKNFQLSVTAAIGDWVDSRSTLSVSYSTAREYLQYRLFFGSGCTIDRAMVIDKLNSPGEYPAELDSRMISAMEHVDDQKVQECVEQFFKTVGSMSYENAISFISQFLTAPIKHFFNLLNVRGESVHSYYQAMHQVAGLQDLQEMADASTKFMAQILDKLKESKSLYSSQKLKSALDWIKENYCDSNISLEIIADKFEISPGYLGRLLYGITYSHFNDYLNSLRLAKASELLADTSLSTEQICRKVGINNTNYFYTLFKKQFHTTPANYRKNLGKNGKA